MEKIQQLEQRITELEKVLKEHQHLGKDGSKEFDGHQEITCKDLTINGLGGAENLFAIPSFKITDSKDIGKERVIGSQAVGTSLEGEDNEQNNVILQIGKGFIEKESNKEDWDKNSFSQIILSHSPNDYPWYLFGFKDLPATAFLTAKRTPIVFGEGTISGDTLTDINANFPVGTAPTSLANAKLLKNSLIHGTILIKDSDFNTIEANRIITTTEKTIKCKYTFENQGKFRYEILIPIALGSANAPFSFGYFGDAIFLGYGGTNARTTNNKVTTILWGMGSPEAVVVASPGSLYLNQSGGAGTSIYIKETGVNKTGWKALGGTTTGWSGSFATGDGRNASFTNGILVSVT